MLGARAAILVAVTAAAAPPTRAQDWIRKAHVTAVPFVVATDTDRGRTVAFSAAGETWEWDGRAWSRRATGGPGPQSGAAMAYDPLRRRVVLVGSGTTSVTTWEWDGVRWSQRASANAPPRRFGHAMWWDAVRQTVMLFGGCDSPLGCTSFNDTWEWDGVDWHRVPTIVAPSARVDHGIAYDTVRQRAVLLGGCAGDCVRGGTTLGDTWEWDGTRWQRNTGAGTIPARQIHGMGFDPLRQRVVAYGGYSWNGVPGMATWEYDGTRWTGVTTSSSPPQTYAPVLFWDAGRQELLLFAGWSGLGAFADCWAWDGSSWTWVTGPPSPRGNYGIAHDASRDRTVLFGGFTRFPRVNDTWEWDGARWQQRFPPQSPPARTTPAMIWDAARQRVVLFGGNGASGLLGDTWEWDGTTWSQRFPATAPAPREGAAMVWDGAGGVAVLFGGRTSGGSVAETWEWDGTTWTQRAPSRSPAGRVGHGLAYDAARDRVVLFGGLAGVGALQSDTWEWDGTDWTPRVSNLDPPARWLTAMAWSPARQRCVLYGGEGNGTTHADTWEWDGTSWIAVRPEANPGPRARASMAYHASLRQLVLFTDVGSTWVYGSSTPARTSELGPGCAGGAGIPALTPFGVPALGNASFGYDLYRSAGTAPAVLVLSARAANLPLGGGCTLWIDPAAPNAGLVGGTTRGGFAHFPVPVPLDLQLLRARLHGQAAVLDPAGTWRSLALSGGLRTTIGG